MISVTDAKARAEKKRDEKIRQISDEVLAIAILDNPVTLRLLSRSLERRIHQQRDLHLHDS